MIKWKGQDAVYTGLQETKKGRLLYEIRLESGPSVGRFVLVEDPPPGAVLNFSHSAEAIRLVDSALIELKHSRHGMALAFAEQAFQVIRLHIRSAVSLHHVRWLVERQGLVELLIHRIERCLRARASGDGVSQRFAAETKIYGRLVAKKLAEKYKR